MLLFLMLALYALAVILSLRACMGPIQRQFPRRAAAAKFLFAALFLAAALLPVCGAFARPAALAAPLRRIGNLWLGFALYALMAAAFWRILAFLLRKHIPKATGNAGIPSRRASALIAAAVLLVSLGTVHAGKIKTVRYFVPAAGSAQPSLRIAFVADLHLGCQIGNAQIAQMVEKINAMNPDLVLFGGDIYDSDYTMLEAPETLAETLRQIRSRYGVYGVYGNHDVTETLIGGFSVSPRAQAYRDQRMAELLKESHITMLKDDAVPINGGKVWLIGRLDGEKSGAGLSPRMAASALVKRAAAQSAVIVLAHEPVELEKLSALGVDLVLSGHTHAGQFFPLTLAQPLIWKNPYGLKRIGDMYSIVTSGVGVYGPPMRILTDSEVVQIDWEYRTGGQTNGGT